MPSNNYRVVVTFTTGTPIAGSHATSEEIIDGCVFIQVRNKNFASFTISLRSPETGVSPVPVFSGNVCHPRLGCDSDLGQTGQQDEPEPPPGTK
jgi:hypothetical protein